MNTIIHNLSEATIGIKRWAIVLLACYLLSLYLPVPVVGANSHELLEQVVRFEYPESQLLESGAQRDLQPEGVWYHFLYQQEKCGLFCPDPILCDVNGDEQPELIIGCTVRNVPKNDKNFLAIYSLSHEGEIQTCLFRKEFEQSMEGFWGVMLDNMTGTGLPDIKVDYMIAGGGSHVWHRDDYLYLIRGRSPFDVLLELNTWSGGGSDTREPEFIEREVTIQDVDDDGIHEVIVTEYEGKGEFDGQRRTLVQRSVYQTQFMLTAYAFTHLQQRGVPQDVLQRMDGLRERVFPRKSEFLAAIEQHIGDVAAATYTEMFLQYAVTPYRVVSNE